MLVKASEIRERYHTELHNVGDIRDLNFKRSLTTEEMRKVHNAWMNDVSAWMSPECLQQYEDLMQQADELDKGKGKGKDTRKDKGANKGSAGKPAKGGRERRKAVLENLLANATGPGNKLKNSRSNASTRS